APADQAAALVLYPCQLSVQLYHESADALVRDEKVRAGTHGSYLEAALRRPLQQTLQTPSAAGAREELRRPAGADRRETREREVRDQPLRGERPSRLERRPHLGRMVRVVVEDPRSRALAFGLEPPGRGPEVGKRRDGGLEGTARRQAGAERGERVQDVVLAGN